MEKLKACPFCGGDKVKMFYDERQNYHVECYGCGKTVSFHIAKDSSWKKAIENYNRRAAPENKALTLFDKITESPEKLAKFLGAIDIGKIELDECFCKSDCGDDSGCPHELQCIINWLDKPEGSKKS